MAEPPQRRRRTDDDRRIVAEARAQLLKDLAAAEGKDRPPLYSPSKVTEPLGLDEHGNYQQPLSPQEQAANEGARTGIRAENPAPAPNQQPRRDDRLRGGLLGTHAGDALGATAELMSWAEVRARYPQGLRDIVGGGPFGWPRGHATDDTDLTRAVLLAYLDRAAGRLPDGDVVRAAADHMLAWLRGDWPGRAPGSHPVDIGGATLTGLRRYEASGDPRRAGAGAGQAGNGSLMRCLPTALATTQRQQRIRESMEISAITHDDPRCTASCAVYNEVAAALLEDAAPETAVGIGLEVAGLLGSAEVSEAVALGRRLDLARLAEHGPAGLYGDGGGYVLDSLAIAVAAVLDRRPLADVVVDVVRLGRDTDTNAAIAAGLLGVRDGSTALPSPWTQPLQFAAEFTAAATQLAQQRN